MKLFRKEEGFTLVELMVVVLIIGILVAIAIPVFNAARGNAQKRSCQANLRTLDGAIEQWRAADPTNDPADWANFAGAMADLGTYVKTTPACPAAGAYSLNGAGNSDPNFVCSLAASDGHEY